MDSRIAAAKDTAKSLRRAISDGIVPGGGIALFACRDALDINCEDMERRAANRMLSRALEAPLRAICHNAGYDGATIAEIARAPSGQGIDIRSGEIRDMLAAGVMDVASVIQSAWRGAVSGAALAPHDRCAAASRNAADQLRSLTLSERRHVVHPSLAADGRGLQR